jgi:hypothetical protein
MTFRRNSKYSCFMPVCFLHYSSTLKTEVNMFLRKDYTALYPRRCRSLENLGIFPISPLCVCPMYSSWSEYPNKVYFINTKQSKVTANTTDVALQSVSTQVEFLFSTATCFGPHGTIIRQYYDGTAKVIELLNMDPYLVQIVHIKVMPKLESQYWPSKDIKLR